MDFKDHLEALIYAINQLDDDPKSCILFFNHPDKKYPMVHDMLHLAIAHINHTDDVNFHHDLIKRIEKWLDYRVHDHMWACHETHFHTTFNQFVCCPFTCLNEISTVIQKSLDKTLIS